MIQAYALLQQIVAAAIVNCQNVFVLKEMRSIFVSKAGQAESHLWNLQEKRLQSLNRNFGVGAQHIEQRLDLGRRRLGKLGVVTVDAQQKSTRTKQ